MTTAQPVIAFERYAYVDEWGCLRFNNALLVSGIRQYDNAIYFQPAF